MCSTLNDESTPLRSGQAYVSSQPVQGSESSSNEAKTSFNQSVFNITKMCMGTGTLGIPFAASQGGILFNIFGLLIIAAWNIYSVERLTKSLGYIQQHKVRSFLCDDAERSGSNKGIDTINENLPVSLLQYPEIISNTDAAPEDGLNVKVSSINQPTVPLKDKPHTSGTLGKVAWYAFGTIGLHTIDTILIILMFGIIIAYEDAILSFIIETPFTTGSKGYDAVLVFLVITPFACISEFQLIAKFSAFGVFIIIGVFIVVANYGIRSNGISGFSQITYEILWPTSLTGFSHWFGVVAFSYGFVPFIYNLQESMAEPTQINRAVQIACMVVFLVYVLMGDIITIIFLPSISDHGFEGDVLSVLPNNWISTLVRLAMSLVMVTTVPLILVPTGDLLLGKIGVKPNNKHASRVSLSLRIFVCAIGAFISAILPDFVYVISFLGCFCVALLSFAYPPIVHLVCFYKYCPRHERKTHAYHLYMDLLLLLLGTVATAFTSFLTYRTLVKQL